MGMRHWPFKLGFSLSLCCYFVLYLPHSLRLRFRAFYKLRWKQGIGSSRAQRKITGQHLPLANRLPVRHLDAVLYLSADCFQYDFPLTPMSPSLPSIGNRSSMTATKLAGADAYVARLTMCGFLQKSSYKHSPGSASFTEGWLRSFETMDGEKVNNRSCDIGTQKRNPYFLNTGRRKRRYFATSMTPCLCMPFFVLCLTHVSQN